MAVTPFELTEQFSMENFNSRIAETNETISALTSASIALVDSTAETLGLPQGDTVDDAVLSLFSALGEGAKIETGSYVGTGTYGSANPNTLTFGFQPKFLLVWPRGEGLYAPGWPYSNTNVKAMIALYGNTTASTGVGAAVTLSWSGTSVSWYNASFDYYQLNYNTNYQYIAIG